ncbi:hypothetical protein RHMOL_Rhmol01G0386600 [Rhododendron molle]|uniref:Uncharacterized protein n=1 Tax=Rhododendron molle TaxID=49168 RepID=A0ACC0QA21_RHOML|nr:hypothetical protein RHMOL_Rhmol01G0386600 [Rhododendron molle]
MTIVCHTTHLVIFYSIASPSRRNLRPVVSVKHIYRKANQCPNAPAHDAPVSVGTFMFIIAFLVVLLMFSYNSMNE